MSQLLKDGTKHLSGLEATVLKNASAVKALSTIVRTSLGPQGMHKMIVNEHDRLFVTSDSATIARELDVQHPAAKMVVMAAQRQKDECGDATNLVLVLCGELMAAAESLIRTGLHPTVVIEGYTRACTLALNLLSDPEALVAARPENVRSASDVARFLTPVISAKQRGYASIIAPLVAQACVAVCPADQKKFNVESVRVAKLAGMGVSDSSVVRGALVVGNPAGSVRCVRGGEKDKVRVAVFQGPLDLPRTETKGTVLVKTAQQLVDYSSSEEQQMEAAIGVLAKAGVKVIVCGEAPSDLALHYCDRAGILVTKVGSKFELRRLCNACGASPMIQLAPAGDKNTESVLEQRLGAVNEVVTEEIGDKSCIVFRQKDESGSLATILVRASTQNVLDDVERAIDDAVCTYRQLCLDSRFAAGAGACEIELAKRIMKAAEEEPGLEQYPMRKFAEALEVVPRTLAENAGLDHVQVISRLYKEHSEGHSMMGVNIDGTNSAPVVDVTKGECPVLDHLLTKRQAIEYATNAITTILRVDQIIIQRPVNGPKIPSPYGAMDNGDAAMA